ncbi:hypothetical protein V8G56_00065 [Gaetbulibacter aquiaggeris]|uniref:Uncharacterized protein n=1 Tax=Gaetbulibacter aquiaggeris TaxID=1735373 RepID=A0ABW7MJV7_9FLAO
MDNEQIEQLRASIKELIASLQSVKYLMWEEELEDFEYYESFIITDQTNKEVCFSILDRLSLIEKRLLKRNKQ